MLNAVPKYNSTFQVFTYPPNSNFDENDWDYFGQVIIRTYAKGPFTKKSKKVVRILIKDRKNGILLDERYKLVFAYFDVDVEWNNFNELNLIVLEVPSIDRGPDGNYIEPKKEILSLEYKYNSTRGKFELVKEKISAEIF
ncbi:MAG: hypothetical protein K8I00_02895 [Candidatus Omnitrophica bacterium]|nr:hypothetical protein [Candidatus Omnitrophota bacterium]